MSALDYEDFLKKIQENYVSMVDSEDSANFYKELHFHKEKQRIALKANLEDLQKNNKELMRKHEFHDVFNQELMQTRNSLIHANVILHKEVLEVEDTRREMLAKYMDIMENIDKCYSDFAKVRCDSDSLKIKLAELKERKLALQKEFNTMSAELQSTVDSMENLSLPLPNAEVVKQIAREVSMECEDLPANELKLEKLKRFVKDFEEKINSN